MGDDFAEKYKKRAMLVGFFVFVLFFLFFLPDSLFLFKSERWGLFGPSAG
jgi:hypothetical protein